MSAEMVAPEYFTHPPYKVTIGDEVADLAKLAGFPPDPEQELVLDPMFALARDGRRVARGVVVIAPRQNIKTGLFKIAALGEAFLVGVELLVWTAHEYDTAHGAFVDLCQLIENTPELDARVKSIKVGNGKESIELLNGSLIKFKARTKKGGKGLSGRRVCLDEAFALQAAHMGSLLPIISAMYDPQVWYGSSAGYADSEVLRSLRDRGRVGDPYLVYAEWCDLTPCVDEKCTHLYDPRKGSGPDGCALDRVDGWKKANSQAGRRIEIVTIDGERRAMARIPLEFARERLGWFDEPGELEHIFGPLKWANCAVKAIKRPPTAGMAIAVTVAVDRTWSTIMSAVPLPGRTLVGVVYHEPGTAGVIAEAKRIQDKYGCVVVVDDHGPAADLIGEEKPPKLTPGEKPKTLRAAGVEVTVAKTVDVLDASASFYDAVQVEGIAHMNHPALEDAVKGAQWRDVGDRKAIGRKTSTAEVSPIEGAILARWGVGKKRKRRRPSSAVV